jgi:MFS family permease
MTQQLDAGNGIRGYAKVLTYGPAVRPFLAAVIARLPISMAALGMIVLVEHVRGAYSIAGIVTGAFAIGTTAGTPVWGRTMDRFGQPKVIVPTCVACAVLLSAVSLSAVHGAPDATLILLAGVAGITFPPISPAMRAAWRVIFTHPRSRRLGYALDASSVELIFVCGPLLLSFLAATTPPEVPLLVAALFMAGGGITYATTSAARGWQPGQRSTLAEDASVAATARHSAKSAVAAPGVGVLLAVSLCMSIGFGQLDTSIVATADRVLGNTDRLGFLFAAIAGGSAVGGLVYGSRHWRGDELRRMSLMLGAFAATLLPVPVLLTRPHPSLIVLLPLLFLTGLTIAPTLIMFQNALDHLAPPHRVNEAQAFLIASMTTGAALGTAAAGIAIDHFGAPGSFTGAVAAIALGSVVCALQVRRWRLLLH